jgi:hypothetical protein
MDGQANRAPGSFLGKTMAKDVNIHIKATGGAEAKQQLEGVAQGAQKVGSGVQDMGSKAIIGSGWVQKALSFLAGPLGFAGIAGAIAGVTIKAAKFFDDIKTRSDEAVLNVQKIRTAFTELFATMNEFSEKGRQALTLETLALFQKVAITKEEGLPVVSAYARAFQPVLKRGEITKPQYGQGLEQMLRYAGRQGIAAIPQMIDIMAGWGMVTPQQQGAFCRMVTEASQAAGLPEEQLVGAIGKGMPAIEAMGWTPEQAIIETATIARTQKTPRQRATMPGMIFETIMRPQIPKELERKIPKEIQEDPARLLNWIWQQQAVMPQKDYWKLLAGVYGAEAGLGFYSWITARETGLGRIVPEAAGPAGEAREDIAERLRQETSEAITARAKAAIEISQTKRQTTEREMRTEIRKRGIETESRLMEEYPIRRGFEKFVMKEESEPIQEAAAAEWWDNLPPEEKEEIEAEYRQRYPLKVIRLKKYSAAYWKWKQMPTKQRYEALTSPEEPPIPAVIYNNNHSHNFNFYPIVDNRQNIMGPRVPKNIH